MKADLAIYSHAVDVSGQCMSESLTLGHNLDFSSCDIMVGFCKSSHIYTSASNGIHEKTHVMITTPHMQLVGQHLMNINIFGMWIHTHAHTQNTFPIF